jgi:hypothetical protein
MRAIAPQLMKGDRTILKLQLLIKSWNPNPKTLIPVIAWCPNTILNGGWLIINVHHTLSVLKVRPDMPSIFFNFFIKNSLLSKIAKVGFTDCICLFLRHRYEIVQINYCVPHVTEKGYISFYDSSSSTRRLR